MFDDVIREIRHLERGMTVSVPLPSDAEGYSDRECPNPECLARFKVHADDWAALVSDAVVFCPVCRHEGDAQQWYTSEQLEYAKELAVEEMKGRIDVALARGVRAANLNSPRGGLISFSFEYRPGPRHYIAPLAAGEVLEQRSTCEACGCRYASIGAAFFCPACGHNSARSTFGDTVKTVRASLELLPRLPELVAKDAAADLGRGIAENALVNLVTGFQRYADASFDALPDPKPAPGFNAFQRLDDGSRLFREATGRGYEAVLDDHELLELARFFQQRHLLVHQQGIVDEPYLDRSGDMTYRLGQRLVIKTGAVGRAADLVEKLAAGLAPLTPPSG